MANQQHPTEEPLLNVEETWNRWERKLDENKKSYGIIAGAIILVVGAYFAWVKLYVGPQEDQAQQNMFMAERYFAQDSLDKAIKGDGNNMGFEEIVDEYGFTSAANLAHYYLGISYLRKGQYEDAIQHLKDFDSNDQMLGPISLGATGDAYMELGKTEEAAEYYLKAAKKRENNFTTPLYLMRAGMAYEELGKYDEAVKVYQRIKDEYDESTEGREIEKYLVRAKTLIEG